MAARILIVEDNPANLSLMLYLLQACGYSVLTATDGAQGVEVARAERPDLVLMDLQLPILSGYEAAELIRADSGPGEVPILAVTAQAMVGDRERVLAMGFTGYVPKPITPEVFVSQIEAFLPPELHSARRP